MQSSCGEKKIAFIACFAYSIIVAVVVIIIIIIIYFFVLLNCLYINPRVLLFVHSPLHTSVGEGEG